MNKGRKAVHGRLQHCELRTKHWEVFSLPRRVHLISFLSRSLSQWVQIDPRLILFIFLPALIYESAMETNYYIFSKHFFSALVLCPARHILSFSMTWTVAGKARV